jgi:Dolichyl-phosphate-mannose-protein mannosyltransferase
MWASFNDAINNSPPLYFGVGWVWAALFGSGETSLRLFTSLAMSFALLVLWRVLREPFGNWPSILGLALAFSSPLIVYQNANARPYGLFLACAAMCVATIARNDLRPLSNRSFFITAAAFALLVQSHLFGPIYAAALIGAQIISDVRRSRLRPVLYIAMAAGVATFVLYLPVFFNQAQNAIPRAWIPPAFLQDLPAFYASIAPSRLPAWSTLWIVLIVGGSIFAVWPQPRRERLEVSHHQQHLLIVAWTLLLVPVAVWFGSWSLKPLFVARYMIPSVLGLAILYAAVGARFLRPLLSSADQRVRFGIRAAAVVVAALAGWTSLVLAQRGPNHATPGSEDTQYGHDDLPIVVPLPNDYLQRRHYSTTPDRYFFLLDWTTMVNPASGDLAPQTYKELSALKKQYPLRFATVLDQNEFLASHPRFLVLKPSGASQACHVPLSYAEKWSNFYCWQIYDRRIASDARFRVTRLGPIDGKYELLLVERNVHWP